MERDDFGFRIWTVTAVRCYLGTPEDERPLFEVDTAEGPQILATREADGTPMVQVQDDEGLACRPHRGDTARRFIDAIEAMLKNAIEAMRKDTT